METYLPLFPLNLVVYPDEDLNLHIFEQRYRQLINECLENDTPFGIPAFINNKMPGYGTEVRVIALHKRYDDGRMDIKTRGIRPFRLIDYENPAPGKLYAGGNVELVEPETEPGTRTAELIAKVTRLYELLKVDAEVDLLARFPSFRVAHKIGLSMDEEYELLTLDRESERQDFLIRHIDRIVPVISEIERTKDRIRQNGHFKNLDPLNF